MNLRLVGRRIARYSLLALSLGWLAVGTAAGQGGEPVEYAPVKPIQLGTVERAQLVESGALIQAPLARSTHGVTGAGLTVAVLDTGLRTTHQDFTGRVVAQRNFTSDNGGSPTDATDGHGHGTNVCGIIVANSVHTGVAPGANVIPVKVLTDAGSSEGTSVDDGLDWVIANRTTYNITCVNMSLGSTTNYTSIGSSARRDRITTLRNAGVAVCISAGNNFYGFSSAQGMASPAIYPESVSVGAVYDANIGGVGYGSGAIAYTTAADRVTPFSQRLHESVGGLYRTDIFAPGGALTSAGIGSDTGSSVMHGTSQACPVIAGVVLLLQQRCLQLYGALPVVDDLEAWLRAGAVSVNDGDDEDDNVTNTGLDFLRTNALNALNNIPAGSKLGFVQQPGVALAGQAISPAVSVELLNANNVRVVGQPVDVTLGIGANPGGAALGGTVTVTTVNGVATFPGISLNRAGTGYTLTAASGSLTGATSSPFDILPGGAASLAFGTQPSTATAGQAMPSFTVEARDALNNLDPTFTGPVTVALGANPGGGTLAGTLTQNAVAGVATFSTVSLNQAAPGYTLQASSGSLTPGTSVAFEVVAAAAAQLGFGVQPADTIAGNVIAPSVQVQVQDTFGNLVTGATNAVTVSLGANPAGDTLQGTLTQNAVAGVATFNDLRLVRGAAGVRLAAAAAGLGGGLSTGFAVSPAAAAGLHFSQQPTPTTAGQVMSPAVVVQVVDPYGNTVTASTATVTLALGTNPAGGVLSGTLVRNAAGGVATFDDLSINRAATNYGLAATASGLGSASSNAFAIVAGPKAKLAFVVQPANGTAGQALAPGVQVAVQDALDNTVLTATDPVALALGATPGGATLGGTATQAAANGVATFADLTIAKAADGYSLVASGAGLTGAASAAFNIGPGPAASLQVTVEPVTSAAGAALPVTVQARDAFGNLATAFTGNVTAALGNNPGSATLAGTTTRAATAGVVVLDDLWLNRAGVGYTLTCGAPGLTGATTAAFNIVPAGANLQQSTVVADPSQAIANGVATAPVLITLLDAFGNPVPGVDPGRLVLAAGGLPQVLLTQPAAATDALGRATGQVAALRPGQVTITVALDGQALAQQPTVTFLPRQVSAANTTVAVAPPAIAVDGADTATITVTLRDDTGQPVIGSPVAQRSIRVTAAETSGLGLNVTDAGATSGDDGVLQFPATATTADLYRVWITVAGVELAPAEVRARTSLATSLPAGLSFFGLPFSADDPRPLQVLGQAGYTLARFDQATNAFVPFTAADNDSAAFALAAGRGFWARTNAAMTVRALGVATPNQPLDLPLQRGWNGLANPYDGSLPWNLNQIQVIQGEQAFSLGDPAAAALVTPYAWIFDGTRHQLVYDPTHPSFRHSLSSVPRGAGFWIEALADGLRLRVIPPVVAAGRLARAVTPRDWSVQLVAEAAGSADTCLVGSAGGLTRALALTRPPTPVADGVTLALVDPHTGDRLAGWIRPFAAGSWAAELLATAPRGGEVTIRWPGLLRQAPAGLIAELTDPVTGRRVNLNTRASYRYTALTAGEQRSLRLAFRFGHLNRPEITSLVVVGGRGEGSTVALQVSAPATVTVTVRGLGGQVVRQLTATAEAAGTVAVTWDGLDAAGRPTPAGAYRVEAVAVAADGSTSRATRTIVRP